MNLFTKIGLGAIIILSITVATLLKGRYQLRKALVQQTTNVKSLERGMQTYEDKNGELRTTVIQQIKTIREIKYSKDSNVTALLKQLKDAKIKISDVSQVGTVTTIIKYVPKPVYINTSSVQDTTVDFSSPPYIVNSFSLKGDTSLNTIEVTNNLQIKNKQSLVWKTKRETIDPPHKFFLCRWFQRKHDVTSVDIKNSNPYLITESQEFIIITK